VTGDDDIGDNDDLDDDDMPGDPYNESGKGEESGIGSLVVVGIAGGVIALIAAVILFVLFVFKPTKERIKGEPAGDVEEQTAIDTTTETEAENDQTGVDGPPVDEDNVDWNG